MSDEAPFGTTGDDSPFWESAAEDRLLFQQCDDCAYVRWPASGVCPECLSRQAHWREFDGSGTIWSHVVYHRAYAQELAQQVPYRVLLVQLDCGVRILSRAADVATPVEVGQRVEVHFGPLGDHRRVPFFRPVPD
ncbi:Zn-ribbon domain-containing OB-fold protein [Gordonia terrae]|uniref:Zn-ribbon domain-containing OB-fold protein n=1 Tax=Gordonia terrae TaxID=2055 RepID=UPI003F6BE88B